MKLPPRSQYSRRAGFAQPAHGTGAEQCSANSRLHPPEGVSVRLGRPGAEMKLPPRSLRSLPPKGVSVRLGRPGAY